MSAVFPRIAIDGHTLGRQAGGNESYVVGLLHGLAECGFDGEVLLYLPQDVEPPAGLRLSISLHRLVSKGPFRRLMVELPSALARHQPDFAHFQYIGPPRSPCPVTIALHDTSFLQAPELFPRRTAMRLRHTTGMAVRRSAAVLVPSAWTAKTLVAQYPDAQSKTHVVPLAPAMLADKETTRAAAGLPERFYLYVGRRQARKNVAFLLRAYADAAQRESGVPPLLLLGPPSRQDDRLHALAKELGIADQVVMRGYVAEDVLAAAYESAELFCYPCRYEGYGLPVVEAMSRGCAVLAANEGGLPETLGGAGTLLPANSLSAWSDAIVRMARAPDARAEAGRAAIERAQHLTWAQTARGCWPLHVPPAVRLATNVDVRLHVDGIVGALCAECHRRYRVHQ